MIDNKIGLLRPVSDKIRLFFPNRQYIQVKHVGFGREGAQLAIIIVSTLETFLLKDFVVKHFVI